MYGVICICLSLSVVVCSDRASNTFWALRMKEMNKSVIYFLDILKGLHFGKTLVCKLHESGIKGR